MGIDFTSKDWYECVCVGGVLIIFFLTDGRLLNANRATVMNGCHQTVDMTHVWKRQIYIYE